MAIKFDKILDEIRESDVDSFYAKVLIVEVTLDSIELVESVIDNNYNYIE